MAEDPVIVPVQQHQTVIIENANTPGEHRPVPSAEDQRLADGVFSETQGQIAAVLLALQTGGGLLHHLSVEALQADDEEEDRRSRPRPPHCDKPI